MTIAVGTNALLALLHDDHHTDSAEQALRNAYTEGPLVITPVVYAEIAADGQFSTTEELTTFLDDFEYRHGSPFTRSVVSQWRSV